MPEQPLDPSSAAPNQSGLPNPGVAAEAANTQAGNFRHRRTGLSVRLGDDVSRGLSVPTKRVAPGQLPVTRSRRPMIRLRREMSVQSQTLFAQAKDLDSLPHYLDGMTPLIVRYLRAERQAVPVLRRPARLSRRAMKRLVAVRDPSMRTDPPKDLG